MNLGHSLFKNYMSKQKLYFTVEHNHVAGFFITVLIIMLSQKCTNVETVKLKTHANE
jgi:hypothetical protein